MDIHTELESVLWTELLIAIPNGEDISDFAQGECRSF